MLQALWHVWPWSLHFCAKYPAPPRVICPVRLAPVQRSGLARLRRACFRVYVVQTGVGRTRSLRELRHAADEFPVFPSVARGARLPAEPGHYAAQGQSDDQQTETVGNANPWSAKITNSSSIYKQCLTPGQSALCRCYKDKELRRCPSDNGLGRARISRAKVPDQQV